MPGVPRTPAALIGAAALVAVLPLTPAQAQPTDPTSSPEPVLDLDPTEVPASGGQVTATGTCSPEAEASEVGIWLEGDVVARTDVDVSTGQFGPVSFTVPGGMEPDDYTVHTVVGETFWLCGSTTLIVLPSPSLDLAPEEAAVSATVTATGTCPPEEEVDEVLLSLDGEVLEEGAVGSTGEFGPIRFAVPEGTESGAHVVETDCGGSATLTVEGSSSPTTSPTTSTSTSSSGPGGSDRGGAPPAPPGTPPGPGPSAPGPSAPGPSASGSSAAGSSTPSPSESSAPSRTSSPDRASPPGRTNPPGQTTTPAPTSTPAEPTAAETSPANTTTPVLPLAGLFAAAALLATAGKGLRDRRGKRWVTEHVETRPGPKEFLLPVRASEQEVRAHRVRLRAHQQPPSTPRQEVEDADRRDHPSDDDPGTALR
jgi:hypothetical protein